jgi:hypothetical protein
MTRSTAILAAALLAAAASASAATSQNARLLGAEELASWKAIRPSLAIRTRTDGGKVSARKAVAIARGQRLSLSVDAKVGAAIRWYLVLPDLTRNYANAAPPWEPNAYAWTGMDAIGYFQIELVGFRDEVEIEPFAGTAIADAVAAITGSSSFYHADVGTFWFAADTSLDGRVARTRGAADVTDRGIAAEVTRVAVRSGSSYVGALEGFYNVAGLFGSTTYQAVHHLGADCADILMAAHSEWRKKPLGANYNVQQLTQKLRKVAELDVADGSPSQALRWGEAIEAGDFIAVKYEGFKKYVHVGALARDDDGDGLLSAKDLILHAGPDPLHLTRLEGGAFDGEVLILRPATR